MFQLRRSLFPVLMTVLALAATAQTCRAQNDDDGDDDGQKPTASLNLTLDRSGHAEVHLSLDRTPDNWLPIQAALGQSLRCPPGTLAHPPIDRQFSGWPMKPEQRARYEKSLTEASQRQLRGSCNDVLTASSRMVSGTLALEPLAEALAQAGEQFLSVRVERPKTAFDEHSSAALVPAFDPGDIDHQFLNYSYPLGTTIPASQLYLAYGYRNLDIARQCAMAVGFLLLPLLLILWMRRAALQDAIQDPAAAWFSYFKTLQWCVNGTMLLWMVARTSFRQGVEDLIAFRLPAGGWQPPVARTLLVIVPPWLVYLLCLFLSYKVFVQFRGRQWTRGEFMLERALDVGAQFLPLMFFCCALDFIRTDPRLLLVLMLAAYASRLLCLRAKIKVSRVAPEALTTGELRDRIFELAKRAGVKMKQVFVVSAGRMQIANAYATGAQTVMFTDYLLQRLTKREVDAIAGHELSHLRHGHPKKLGFTLLGVILFPSIFRGLWTMFVAWFGDVLLTVTGGNRYALMEWYRWGSKLGAWSQLDLVLIIAGFGLFYLLARRFERIADEGSVQLVGDPEAMIAGLLKVSRLNLTPIQWGKVTGSILTHPTTLKRIEHLAEVGKVPQERVRQLLTLHAQEEQARLGDLTVALSSSATPVSTPSATSHDEHYAVPSSQKNVVSTITALRRASNNQWLLIAANVLPPALVARSVHELNLHGQASLAAYLVGAVLIVAGYSWLGLHLSLRGRGQLRRQFAAKFDAEGIQVRGRNAVLAGLAPGATLRTYLSGYDWDKGFVWLLQVRLIYLGDKIRFALTPGQVVNVRVGESAPGWWNSERVYLQWRDAENGREGTFSFYPYEPSSAGKIKSEGKVLCAAIERWKTRAAEYPAAAPVAQLQSPVLGEVTSHDPKDRLRRGKRVNTLILLWLLSYVACSLLGASGWYGFWMVVILRIYERIPYWRYRAPAAPLAVPQSQVARAQVTGASR